MRRIVVVSIIFILCVPLAGQGGARSKLLRDLTHADPLSRQEAISALLELGDEVSLEAVFAHAWAHWEAGADNWPQELINRLGQRPRKPSYLRFFIEALAHPVPGARSAAAVALRREPMPWVWTHVLDGWSAETEEATRLTLLGNIAASPGDAEGMASLWRRASTDGCSAQERAAILATLYDLGVRRGFGTRFTSVLAGTRGLKDAGFGPGAIGWGLHPLRKKKAHIQLPGLQEVRPGAMLLLGYKSRSPEVVCRISLRLGGVLLGTTSPGDSPVAPRSGLQVASLEIPGGMDSPELLEIRVEEGNPQDLSVQGVVVLRTPELANHRSSRVFSCSPGTGGVAMGEGCSVLGDRLPRFAMAGDDASLILDIDQPRGFATLVFSHWTKGPPSAWDVEIGGKPLMRIISQELPRPVRCSAALLAPGKNTIRFHRLHGGTLVLDTIRLVQ